MADYDGVLIELAEIKEEVKEKNEALEVFTQTFTNKVAHVAVLQDQKLKMDIALLKANHRVDSQANFNKELVMGNLAQKKQIEDLQK